MVAFFVQFTWESDSLRMWEPVTLVCSSYHRVFKNKQAFIANVESKHKAKKLIDSEYILGVEVSNNVKG